MWDKLVKWLKDETVTIIGGAILGIVSTIAVAVTAFFLGYFDSYIRKVAVDISYAGQFRDWHRTAADTHVFSAWCFPGDTVTDGGTCVTDLGDVDAPKKVIENNKLTCTFRVKPGGAPPVGRATAACLKTAK